MTVSQYPSFLRQFATKGLGISWDNLSTNLLESLQNAKDAANAIYETGKALATGEITVNDLISAMGQNVWDGLSGDLRYLINNYDLFDPDLELTDEQLTELAHRTAGAYEETVGLAAMLNGSVKSAKSIMNARKVDNFINSNVPASFRDDVRKAFTSDAKVTTLTKDLTVYRYYGNGANPKSFWVTPYQYSDPISKLALPPVNSVGNMATYTIPKGTTILEGTVARNFEQLGGGYQIYIPDPSLLK